MNGLSPQSLMFQPQNLRTPRFGNETPAAADDESKPAATASDDQFEKRDAGNVEGTAKLSEENPIGEQADPSKLPEDGPIKNRAYWIKSAALSGVSLGMLALGLGLLPVPGGFFVSTLLIAGAMLAHNITGHVAQKNGLADLNEFKKMLLERGQPHVEFATRLLHPFNEEKRKVRAQQIIHQVQQIDPQRQFNRNGVNFGGFQDALKAEGSFVKKATIAARFVLQTFLHEGFINFMKRRGRIVAIIVPLIWSWITGKKQTADDMYRNHQQMRTATQPKTI